MAAYTRTQCVYACTVPPVACRPLERFRVDFTLPIWTSFVPKPSDKVLNSLLEDAEVQSHLYFHTKISKLYTFLNYIQLETSVEE